MHVHLVFQGLELPELVGRAHLAHRGVVDAAREREERAGEQDVVALLRRAAARRAQAAPGAAARPRLAGQRVRERARVHRAAVDQAMESTAARRPSCGRLPNAHRIVESAAKLVCYWCVVWAAPIGFEE